MTQKVLDDIKDKAGDLFARETVLTEKEKKIEYDRQFVEQERNRLEKIR
jgi:hypothetical protein